MPNPSPTEDKLEPTPKGKTPRIQKISLEKWNADDVMTLSIKVNTKPKLSASRKCYVLAFRNGESDITIEVGGVQRKVRMSLILYVKVPATERRATLESEAKQAEAFGEPKLY